RWRIVANRSDADRENDQQESNDPQIHEHHPTTSSPVGKERRNNCEELQESIEALKEKIGARADRRIAAQHRYRAIPYQPDGEQQKRYCAQVSDSAIRTHGHHCRSARVSLL